MSSIIRAVLFVVLGVVMVACWMTELEKGDYLWAWFCASAAILDFVIAWLNLRDFMRRVFTPLEDGVEV